MPLPAAAQLSVHPWSAVTALRFLMHGLDLRGQVRVVLVPPRGAGR